MNILTIDIGNTNITIGLWQKKKAIAYWPIRSDKRKTVDEYRILVQQLLSEHPMNIDVCIIGSVVPPLTFVIAQAMRHILNTAPLLISPGIHTNLTNILSAELGDDLLANAVAAYELSSGPSIVADFGTALTFTAVSGKGEVLGVSISPGMQSSLRCLTDSTAQLHTINLSPPISSALGHNTTEALQNGITWGYVGLVEYQIKKIQEEIGEPAQVIATGGDAHLIAPYTSIFSSISRLHTLTGFRVLAELNHTP